LKMLMETFAKREIEKTYLAITEVKPPKEEDELENWLVKDNTFRKAMLYNSEVKYSSKVILRYKVLSEVSSRCLLQVNLVTGKYHQIRAQLSHIGCPIIGDARYGAKTVYKENAICLHANSLRLMHPVTNEPLHITCPPPDDEFWNPFREVWK
jgi:23S rRNA pseudouridine1911/1915/1917 synthase